MKYLFILSLVLPVCAQAQKDYSNDVKSIDAIITALYEVISGDPCTARDWDRFRNLFTADARLIPTGKNAEGKITYRTMSPEDYVTMFTTRITTGFFEWELHRVTEEYGTIAHVFSTYETKEKKNGPVTNRGINSIQILKQNDRYAIMNIFWCPESAGFALPEKYLK
ncbi:MAG: nuclear transport factor 2 family protein [Cyclobacteriaceae bacterium]|nr:nuclear transport factor 2 family protein [Cyclobacteriaceae bacterium]UYN85986.1 MAG: nuclear transport factor 2 family protein [Cyclobacteriaceae bacterium]